MEEVFKEAFYALWKCCNSAHVITDDAKPDVYIEFRIGYESVCVGLSQSELDAIVKACDLLDLDFEEV